MWHEFSPLIGELMLSVEKRLQEENETILHYQQLMREIVSQVIRC